MNYVDLHCHSTASDGTFTPTQVVDLAKTQGLSAIALTDHDTVAGVAEAAKRAAEVGIDFLPGIEISAAFPHPGTLHLLGYGVDPTSPALVSLSEDLLAGRDSRNPKIIARLQEFGIKITMPEVEAEAKGGVLGRPHIAAVLLKKGYVSTIKQAFNVYLAPGGSAFFDKERLEPREAIRRIRDAGGVPVLAHPSQLRTTNAAELDRVVKSLVDQGLAGIETLHSDHTDDQVKAYESLAKKYGLLTTGGSDFHGGTKPTISLGYAGGKRRVPRAFFDALAARRNVSPTT
ncbi:MAG: PHP domain-containing protein [Tepidisphaeraceae bacterium]